MDRRTSLTNQLGTREGVPEKYGPQAVDGQAEKEKRQSPGPEGHKTEIERLQLALSHTLEQLKQLRAENEALSKQLLQERRQSNQLQAENKRTKNLLAAQKKASLQTTQLQHRLNMSEKKLMLLETRYNALANSKLGRLTLNYWAWHKQKQLGGQPRQLLRGQVAV